MEVIDSAEVGLRLQLGLEDPAEFESVDSELEGSAELVGSAGPEAG